MAKSGLRAYPLRNIKSEKVEHKLCSNPIFLTKVEKNDILYVISSLTTSSMSEKKPAGVPEAMKPVDRVKAMAEKAKAEALAKKQEQYTAIRAEIDATQTELAGARDALQNTEEALKAIEELDAEAMSIELESYKQQLAEDLKQQTKTVDNLYSKLEELNANPVYIEMAKAEKTQADAAHALAQKEEAAAEQRQTIEAIGNFTLDLQKTVDTFKQKSAELKQNIADLSQRSRDLQSESRRLNEAFSERERQAFEKMSFEQRGRLQEDVPRELGFRRSPEWYAKVKEIIKPSIAPWSDKALKAYLKLADEPQIAEAAAAENQANAAMNNYNAAVEERNQLIRQTLDDIAALKDRTKSIYNNLNGIVQNLRSSKDPLHHALRDKLLALNTAIEETTTLFQYEPKVQYLLGFRSDASESVRKLDGAY